MWSLVWVALLLASAVWHINEARRYRRARLNLAEVFKAMEADVVVARDRLQEDYDAKVVEAQLVLRAAQEESIALLNKFIARCEAWSADPWNGQWNQDDIFHDLRIEAKRKH